MTTDNKQSVLTDEEIRALSNSVFGEPISGLGTFARNVEQAVLSKLRGGGEPVAVVDRGIFGDLKWTGAGLAYASRLPDGTKLYAAPQACDTARLVFPAHLRKMWSGGEVQAWIDEQLGTTAQKATAKGSLERYRKWQAEQTNADARKLVADGWLEDHITANVKFTRGEMPGVYYCQGWRDAETHYKLAAPAAEPTIVKLHAWGGQSRHHDYLMSDGSIRTLKDTEANAMRNAAESPAKGAGDAPDLGSPILNEACWKFVESMPHQLPGPIFNDLKPALYAAVCYVLADRQQRDGGVSLAVEALRAAQNNLAACRPSGSSDPKSPDYDHDAFMWDYYQRATDAALASQKPLKE